ncbi:MAG: 5-(carboxyamino)imidazole ribonucleotide synthase [Anaerolineae bacterium]|nr:5-(carboxyamino)imidazole ribonucleotide synthase [Gloeobacterales cyanobacterium ES-bin-313]
MGAEKFGMPTVGIIGGGQLGRMTALAAHRLGIAVVLLDPDPYCSAAQVVPRMIVAPFDDPEALEQLATSVDVVTYENEWLNPEQLGSLERQGYKVRPSAYTLARIQDKFFQRTDLQKAGLPVPVFAAVDSLADLEAWVVEQGFPVVIKMRVQGYDGRGVRIAHTRAQLVDAWAALSHQPLLAEAFVPFTKELAVMVARSELGEVGAYPVVETVQKNNVCHTVSVPADIDALIAEKCRDLACAAVECFDGVGIFGIELFLKEDGIVLINELAPRPHNSGHYSLDACLTDQFEQYLRAIFGLPLGATALHSPAAAMVNILGEESMHLDLKAILDFDVHLHWYGKPESRPGRKLGHMNAVGKDPKAALAKVLAAHQRLGFS